MRQPTPDSVLYDFYARTVAGERVPRSEGDPQCGWYQRRFVKDGPFVPVRIWMEQPRDPETGELCGDETIRAECDGQPVDVVKIWTYCRAIPKADYDALVRMRQEEAIMAATHAPIDLSQSPMRPGGNHG